mgnify:FL=1
MDIDKNIKYKIDSRITDSYVEAINSIDKPMNQIKEELSIQQSKKKDMTTKQICQERLKLYQQYEAIKQLSKQISTFSRNNSNEQCKIYTDTISQIMNANKGMLSTRMIEPLNISRQYLAIMEAKKMIEKVSRGLYVLPSAYEDSYFLFQQKYKKAIFSHMNALYFHNMTEEFPYNYTVTVPQNYHVDTVNEKCNVFYVSNEIYEIGLTEVETPNGVKVKSYDIERCICDIIRSKGRLDQEQVKKAIKNYIQSNNKDMAKLSLYAEKMGIIKKVMEMVGDTYYE